MYCTLIHYIALSELLIPVMNVCAKHGNALNAANKMPAPNISIMSFVSNWNCSAKDLWRSIPTIYVFNHGLFTCAILEMDWVSKLMIINHRVVWSMSLCDTSWASFEQPAWVDFNNVLINSTTPGVLTRWQHCSSALGLSEKRSEIQEMHRDLTSWVTVVVRPRILMELYAALSLYESRTTAAPAVTGAAFGSGKFVVPTSNRLASNGVQKIHGS